MKPSADPLRVGLKIVNGNEDLGIPTYSTPGASGMDLRAALAEPLVIGPMERAHVPTGVAAEIPSGFEGQVRPRSGLALERGVTVLNAPGTIDSDYRGEIGVILVNLGIESTTICRGDRIAQLVVSPVRQVAWQQRSDLNETHRGSGGFGHTGT